MPASILNSVPALGASRQLGVASTGLQKAIERLTTGRRINRASDDAAGLGISNKLSADIRTAAQGRRNANDGISYLQVADGVLEEVTSLLIRGTELAQQAQTGTISNANRLNIDAEFQNILATLADIGQSTKFNGAAVFSQTVLAISVGSFTPVSITVGTISTSTSVLGLNTATTSTVIPPTGWVSDGAGGYKPAGADWFYECPIDPGGYHAMDDADNDPGTPMDRSYLTGWAPPGWTLGADGTDYYPPTGWTPTDNGLWDAVEPGFNIVTGFTPPPTVTASTNLATADAAASTAILLGSALDLVSNLRATLGASMQQLNAISNSLGIQVENFTSAFSQIRDAQVAEEVVSLTKFQILGQSGTSALGQANQAQQGLLALLQ